MFLKHRYLQNWHYDGDLGPSKLASRPFGWFAVLIGGNSNMTYDMAMVAHELGYKTMLQVHHLDTVSMSSSVNQSRFLYADSCKVRRCYEVPFCLTQPTLGYVRNAITTPMEPAL